MSLGEELKLHELHGRGALSSEEYARAKAKLLSEATPARPFCVGALNAVRRSRGDRWIAGVCGGLARATGAEAWVWRLVFALLFLCGGAGLVGLLADVDLRSDRAGREGRRGRDMITLHAVGRGFLRTLHERLQKQLEAPNLGTADCLLRIAGGLVLTALAVDGSIGAWGFLGLLFVATGAAWVCPLYRWLGLSSARSHP